MNSLQEAHKEEKRRRKERGLELARLRRELGVTQQQLCDAVGVSQPRVYTWERVRGVNGAVFEYLCRELKRLAKEKKTSDVTAPE